jgi:hypothetical protein
MSITESHKKLSIVDRSRLRASRNNIVLKQLLVAVAMRRLSVRENGPVLLSARRKIKLLLFQEKTADSSG